MKRTEPKPTLSLKAGAQRGAPKPLPKANDPTPVASLPQPGASLVRLHEPEPTPRSRPTSARPPRRTTPTTPLQHLPPIGGVVTTKVLTECEDAVLALITLDPRLVHGNRREVLRLLATLLHPAFDAVKVGQSLGRLRQYQARGWLNCRALRPWPLDAAGQPIRWPDPEPTAVRDAMVALVDRYGGHVDPPAGRVAYAQRLLCARE
jgi:hypothetical protein